MSQSDELSIIHIFEDTIKLLCEHLSDEIKSADIERISVFDGMLSAFCSANGLSYPETTDSKLSVRCSDENPNKFLPEIFGESVSKAKIETDFTKEIIECIKKHINNTDETVNILFTNNDPDFKEYFNNKAFIKKAENTYDSIRRASVAIYKDKKFDLHLTVNGILAVSKNTPQEFVSYSKVKTENDKIILTKKSYPVSPSIADVFTEIIRDVKKLKTKYMPADEKTKEHTAIDELLTGLYFDIDNMSEFLRKATLAELESHFSNYNDDELINMLNNGEFGESEFTNSKKRCQLAVKIILRKRGYAR